jgi:hypothetical protein
VASINSPGESGEGGTDDVCLPACRLPFRGESTWHDAQTPRVLSRGDSSGSPQEEHVIDGIPVLVRCKDRGNTFMVTLVA